MHSVGEAGALFSCNAGEEEVLVLDPCQDAARVDLAPR